MENPVATRLEWVLRAVVLVMGDSGSGVVWGMVTVTVQAAFNGFGGDMRTESGLRDCN